MQASEPWVPDRAQDLRHRYGVPSFRRPDADTPVTITRGRANLV